MTEGSAIDRKRLSECDPCITHVFRIMGHRFILMRDGIVVTPVQFNARLLLIMAMLSVPAIFIVALGIGAMTDNQVTVATYAVFAQIAVVSVALVLGMEIADKGRYSRMTCDELRQVGTFVPKEKIKDITVKGEGATATLQLPLPDGSARCMRPLADDAAARDLTQIRIMKTALDERFAATVEGVQ